MHVSVTGAGAAGCLAAIEIKRRIPGCDVTVFEAGRKALAKVAVTGGGRCNLTNTFEHIKNLEEAYPRGDKLMRRALRAFSQEDTLEWFASAGIETTAQDDGCIFPVSQDAMQIVNTLLSLMRAEGVRLRCGCSAAAILPDRTVVLDSGEHVSNDAVLVTTGGCPLISDISFLSPLGLQITPPVPSLFTFNINDPEFKSLMGTVVRNVRTGIAGTPFHAGGPLLITHWGASGPAILKLSSYAAVLLAGRCYRATLTINWLGGLDERGCHETVESLANGCGNRSAANTHPDEIPSRLWEYLLKRAGIRADRPLREAGKNALNRLAGHLVCDCHEIEGKSRWRDEFVTCGGVSLNEISMNTMECRRHPGIFFAGEVLDIDAITGGFNLQAAWSTGMSAAKGIETRLKTLQ